MYLHLFYTDLLEEFLDYFQNIPCPFDLYISCVKGADKGKIWQKAKESLKQLNRVDVCICKNRGRDIAPFYVTFGRELEQYEYLLHVHSKKSKHIEKGGADWRVYSLRNLLGSRELVEEILHPYPDCNVLDKRDLPRHFRNFGEENTVFSLEDKERYYSDQGYQQYLAFFSDNNSCLKRSVWEEIPYQDVDFAED